MRKVMCRVYPSLTARQDQFSVHNPLYNPICRGSSHMALLRGCQQKPSDDHCRPPAYCLLQQRGLLPLCCCLSEWWHHTCRKGCSEHTTCQPIDWSCSRWQVSTIAKSCAQFPTLLCCQTLCCLVTCCLPLCCQTCCLSGGVGSAHMAPTSMGMLCTGLPDGLTSVLVKEFRMASRWRGERPTPSRARACCTALTWSSEASLTLPNPSSPVIAASRRSLHRTAVSV